MENTNMFHHPKYYKELRKRNKSDQVISETKPTGDGERAPGQGLKQHTTSDKPQAGDKPQAKPEPSSGSEAASSKLQAPSYKRQA